MLRGLLVVVLLVAAVGLVYGAFKLTKRPAAVNPEIQKLQAKGKLVVGTDATYPPMESLDKNGKVIGFDIDLITETASQLGVPLEIKNISWDDLFKSLESGEVDLAISSVTITPERSKIWLFSKPYFSSGQAIVVAKTNASIKTPADLKDQKVAVQKDTTGETETLKYVADKLVERFISNYGAVVEKVEKGKLAALIIDYPVAVNIAGSHPALKVIPPFTSEFYGMVFRKDSSGLVGVVDEILANLKSTGKQKEIELKWFK